MFTAHMLVEGCEFPHLRATTTLISDGRTNVIVDPGAKYDRELLLKSMADRGLRPGDVDIVINTHMHYDHFENTELFEKAKVIISRSEFDEYLRCVLAVKEEMQSVSGIEDGDERRRRVVEFFEETIRARYELINGFYLSRISYGMLRDLAFWTACEQRLGGRLTLTDGEYEIGRNVTVSPTPGHTPGHLSVWVVDPERRRTVVAGDAFPTVRWLGAGRAPMPLCANVGQFLRTKDELARAAHYVIPGHGGMFSTHRASQQLPDGDRS